MSSSRETQQIEEIVEEQFDKDSLGCSRGAFHAIPLCILFWVVVIAGLYWLMK